MKEILIYTDGACSGNPGPGGWGAVLLYGEHRKEISGYDPHTTNNRMELTAPIRALRLLKEPCHVTLYSDSSYLIDSFQKHWIDGWKRRGWVKSNKEPVPNQDLWQELLGEIARHQMTWVKVRGHADNAENNRCDELATGEIRAHKAGAAR